MRTATVFTTYGTANYWTDSLKNHPGYLSGTSNEPAICRQVAQNIGADKVYAFNYDWRLDACETVSSSWQTL